MIRLPPHPRGLKIGLFGGTFDPPHAAHRAACLLAMQRLDLDRVWWLVTPGNPLKDTRGLAPLSERIAAAEKLADNPRIIVTGIEAEMRTRYTYDTVRTLTHAMPRRALRLDHGRRQPAQLPSLAEVARHRRPLADRGGRPRRPEPLRDRRPRRAGAVALPHPGAGRKVAAAPQAARVGFPARPEVAALLYGVARTASEIMDALTAFGLFAVTAMLVIYALEDRSPWFILAFAGACALGSVYGFLQGAWPFGVIEAIWAGVAVWRWVRRDQAANTVT